MIFHIGIKKNNILYNYYIMEKFNNEYKNNIEYYNNLKYNIIKNINGRICHHKIVILHIICKLFRIETYLEIGVHNGSSMSYIVSEEQTKKCYGIDLFDDTISRYSHDNLMLNNSYQNILNNNINSQINLIKGNSFDKTTITELENKINKESVDLLFIDGDHTYEGIKNDFINYYKFVKKNGFIIIDDYEPNYPDIVKFVDEYIKNNDLFDMVGVFENNDLIIIKK
jgi:predicted O-methyltransferase YrrM